MSDKTSKENKTQENPLPAVDESAAPPAKATAIGRFEEVSDAEKAVDILKQEGYSDEAISMRDFSSRKPDVGEAEVAAPNGAIVGVQAEGERAAEAWSILQTVVEERSQLISDDIGAGDSNAKSAGVQGHEANEDKQSDIQGLDTPVPADKSG